MDTISDALAECHHPRAATRPRQKLVSPLFAQLSDFHTCQNIDKRGGTSGRDKRRVRRWDYVLDKKLDLWYNGMRLETRMESKPRGRPKGTTKPNKALSPRARLALKAVVLGMKHKDAAAVVGLHPAYVSQLKNNALGKTYVEGMNERTDATIVDTHKLLSDLAHEAVLKMAGLMRFSSNENVILRAAQDLADRGPLTRKVQKHEVESITMSGKDVAALRSAMIEAAQERERYADAVVGDFVKVPLELPSGEP